MNPEDNPADERTELDLCIEEIKRLQEQLQASRAEAFAEVIRVLRKRQETGNNNAFANNERLGIINQIESLRDGDAAGKGEA